MALSFVNPESLGAPRGFNHGVLAEGLLFVAGQTAVAEDGAIIAGGMAAQWERALMNVLTVVNAAGGSETDIARMTVYVTDRDAYLSARVELSGIWRSLMGRHYPAMSVIVVTALVDDNAMVEIEATAVLPKK